METSRKIYLMSAGELAFVGDSVFSLLVRSRLAMMYDTTAGRLNRMANKLVCASAQAKMLAKIESVLTEQEHDIVMRARNISPNNVPRSSTIAEYTQATALESLFGYLHLSNQKERLEDIFNLCVGDQL